MFFQNIFWNRKHVTNQFKKARNFCHVIIKNYLCNVSWKFLIKIESTWRRKIKEQATHLTLLYRGRTVRSSHRRWCCIRKLFLKILQYTQETPVLESIFKKGADLYTCNFIKKRPQHRCFPVNIAKFLILPILKKPASGSFLLFSMVHSYMDLKVWGLDYTMASGFRVRVAGLVFLFKLASLALKQVPTCIQKPKTNTFEKSSFYGGYFWSL